MSDFNPGWHRRRVELNHDLLQNQLLPALGRWVHVLAGEIDDPGFGPAAQAEILSQWADARDRAAALIAEYPSAASPFAGILDSLAPDMAALTRWFLAAVAQGCWQGQRSITRWDRVARRRLAAADRAAAAAADDPPTTASVAAFRSSCRSLTRVIGRLPKSASCFGRAD